MFIGSCEIRSTIMIRIRTPPPARMHIHTHPHPHTASDQVFHTLIRWLYNILCALLLLSRETVQIKALWWRYLWSRSKDRNPRGCAPIYALDVRFSSILQKKARYWSCGISRPLLEMLPPVYWGDLHERWLRKRRGRKMGCTGLVIQKRSPSTNYSFCSWRYYLVRLHRFKENKR